MSGGDVLVIIMCIIMAFCIFYLNFVLVIREKKSVLKDDNEKDRK